VIRPAAAVAAAAAAGRAAAGGRAAAAGPVALVVLVLLPLLGVRGQARRPRARVRALLPRAGGREPRPGRRLEADHIDRAAVLLLVEGVGGLDLEALLTHACVVDLGPHALGVEALGDRPGPALGQLLIVAR